MFRVRQVLILPTLSILLVVAFKDEYLHFQDILYTPIYLTLEFEIFRYSKTETLRNSVEIFFRQSKYLPLH